MSDTPEFDITPPLEPPLDRLLTRRVQGLLLALLLVASPVVWLAIKPFVWVRTVEFSIMPTGQPGPDWALEWQHEHDCPWNGIWLSLSLPPTHAQTIEVKVPWKSTNPDGSKIGFHLYEVNGSMWTLRRADLKSALARWQQDPISMQAAGWDFQGHWFPGVGEGGGICCDSEGVLRIPVPAYAAQGNISLNTEKMLHGGDISVQFAGVTQQINTFAKVWEGLGIPLPRSGVEPVDPTLVRATLPAYAVADVRFAKPADAGGAILSPVTLRTSVFGMAMADRTFRWGDGARDIGGGQCEVTGPGARLGVPIKTTIPVHAFGSALVATALLGVWCGVVCVAFPVSRACVRSISAMFHRWRGERVLARRPSHPLGPLFWLVLCVVALVHAWVAHWAPMDFPPDSVEYVINAQRLFETHSVAHFNAWRLPGTSFVLLPFIAFFTRPEHAMALAQAFGGVLIAIMSYDVARRFMPRGAALLAMLLVGLDPTMLVWERHVMSEGTFTFAIVLWVWLLVRLIASRRTPSLPWWRTIAWAIALGVVSGFSPLIRGNAQLLLLAAPIGVIFALVARASILRAMAAGALVAGASLLVVVPWAMHIRQRFGQPAIMIGGGVASEIFTWNAGLLDVNQTALYDAANLQAVKQQEVRTNDPFTFMHRITQSPRVPYPPGIAPWVGQFGKDWLKQNSASGVAASESRARRGPECLREMIVGLASPLFRVGNSPFPATSYWARPMFGKLLVGGTNNWYMGPEQLIAGGWDATIINKVYARTQQDLAPLANDPDTRLFHALYSAFERVRMFLGALWILGGIFALREWNRPLLIIWGVSAATLLALAYLVYGGESRYIEPFYPLMTIIAAFGLARLLQHIAASNTLHNRISTV